MNINLVDKAIEVSSKKRIQRYLSVIHLLNTELISLTDTLSSDITTYRANKDVKDSLKAIERLNASVDNYLKVIGKILDPKALPYLTQDYEAFDKAIQKWTHLNGE